MACTCNGRKIQDNLPWGYEKFGNLSTPCNEIFKKFRVRKCKYPDLTIRTGCIGVENGCLFGNGNLLAYTCEDSFVTSGKRICRDLAIKIALKNAGIVGETKGNANATRSTLISFDSFTTMGTNVCPDCSKRFGNSKLLLEHCMLKCK